MKFLEALSQQGEHKTFSSENVRDLALKRRAFKNLVEQSVDTLTLKMCLQ